MKSLLKLAVGAAIAGALVNLLMKQQSGKRTEGSRDELSNSDGPEASYDVNAGASAGTSGATTGEMVGDTNTAGSGEESQDQRNRQQPQDWRGAQNVLDS